MRIERYEFLRRFSACLLTLLLVLPVTALAQETAPSKEAEPPAQSQTLEQKAPAAEPPQSVPPLPDSPSTSQPPVNQGQSSAESAPASQEQTPTPKGIQKPVGTAAAGVVNSTGVAASRPAGAALAPARQRRVRLLMIKLGVVAAAGVALGATLALTAASPSRPPGAN